MPATGPDDLKGTDPLDGQVDITSVVARFNAAGNIAQRALDRFNGVVVQCGPGPQSDPGVQAAVNNVITLSQQLTQAAQAYVSPVGTFSTIELKKDVHYLTDAEQARIAREALSLKLASFRYTNTPETDRRARLGFMLEDAPTVAAADMQSKQVDLYAYTSMVLALVQEQQREIAALRAEVERLKK